MSYSIVYSSNTGNTKLLAETIRDTLPKEECIYFGESSDEALKADKIYIGFWTDKGVCDADTLAFFKKLTEKNKVYLFGTAGFGGVGYYEKILEKSEINLPEGVEVFGKYMCRGKMPMAVRDRYVNLKETSDDPDRFDMLIKNFDKSLSHPNEKDLQKLINKVKNMA